MKKQMLVTLLFGVLLALAAGCGSLPGADSPPATAVPPAATGGQATVQPTAATLPTTAAAPPDVTATELPPVEVSTATPPTDAAATPPEVVATAGPPDEDGTATPVEQVTDTPAPAIPVETDTPLPADTPVAEATEGPPLEVTEPPAPQATPASAPEVSSPPAGDGNVTAAVVRALRGLADARSYRAKVTITAGAPPDLHYDVEYVAPDRAHLISTDADDREEMIMIGDALYDKKNTGSWQLLPSSGHDTTIMTSKTVLEQMIAGISATRGAGAADVDGTPGQVYEFNANWTTKPQVVTSGPLKLWVATSDGLPRRLDAALTTTVNGQPIPGGTSSTLYYDYNADITITAPTGSR